MIEYSAIAIIEFETIFEGIRIGDLMLKYAPVSMIRTGTISGGNFIVMIAGSVGSVEIAYNEGLRNSNFVEDSLFIPDINKQVLNAINDTCQKIDFESIAVLETKNVSSIIKCADIALKEADVRLIQMRLADNLGGKSFAIFNGSVENIQAAIQKAVTIFDNSDKLIGYSIIPRFDSEFATHLEKSTRFSNSLPQSLIDGEI